MLNFFKKIFYGGFTVIEFVVTVFIFLTGIIGVYTIVSYQITDIKVSQSRLIALYLSQEGIEIVKNIRDGNLIEGGTIPWGEGLEEGCYVMDYSGLSNFVSCGDCSGFSYLRRSGATGFYRNSVGNETKFRRKIEIQDEADHKKIIVTTCWTDNGKKYQAVVADNIYGYWNP